MKLLLVGPGRCGKDTAGEFLARHTNLKFAGTTSKFLTKYVAQELKVDEKKAYEERHANRMTWYTIGNQIRESDPGRLIKEALEEGDITGGIRDRAEIEWAHHSDLIDLIIWIENPSCELDPTLTFTKDWADILILNDGDIKMYYRRLWNLAKSLGILKG